MAKKLLATMMLCYATTCVAGNNYAPTINKHTEQIKSIIDKLEALENDVHDLKTQLHNTKQLKISPAHQEGAISASPNISPPGNMPRDLGVEGIPNTGNTAGYGEISGEYKQDRREYDIALATLKEKKYDEAEIKFKNFLDNYPESDLVGNAFFWYAETFYHRSLYQRAAIYYLKGYKEYRNNEKAPNSLLKLAYSLGYMKRYDQACKILQKLDNEFPERPNYLKSEAQKAVNKFNCR
ncbi:MAG: tol-pal system protein YbgF [Rickettsiaceae bacterium]|nr:tol-pal system protein YbgF [Rickettsiaceae bacterium]